MGQTISSDFIRGHIDTIILRSLFSGTKHALEIASFIEEKSGSKYEVKQATLYSALKRLEKQKYVRPFWNDAPEGGRRRYFEITPAGKAFADKNLSGWDYSRDVIDQLVDEVPKNLVHESGVVLSGKSSERKNETDRESAVSEKIEEKEIKETVTQRDISEKEASAPIERKAEEKIVFERVAAEEKPQPAKVEEVKDPALEMILNKAQTEFNYREILNELFDKNVKKHRETEEETAEKPIAERVAEYDEKTTVETEQPPQFAALRKENVFDKDFRIKSQNTGKTDFSDLLEKADAEGYKIRISTGKSEKIGGKFLINRINLVSSLSVFLIFLIECLVFSLIFKQDELFSGWYYLIAIGIAAILPAVCIVLYSRQPTKTKPTFNKNLIYTVLIILFNLLLIVIALAVLTNADFSSGAEIALKIVAPILVLFDAFLFFLFRNICSLSDYFVTKRQ
ncbi:MAG: hypothetical protein DBX59_09955 [Bacillota bacterium]|nr:MAG: hypothetical protein DBX59_09955 [Bacillota bacterium]